MGALPFFACRGAALLIIPLALLLPAVGPGGPDVAQAQSSCACPAGFSANVAAGLCTGVTGVRRQPISVPLACRPDLRVGETAANLEQLSYSTVAGMLRRRRDRLQANMPLPSPRSAYASVASDESTDPLDGSLNAYDASARAARNPLMAFKAPPAPVAPSGPAWAVWSEVSGDWERRAPLNLFDFGRTQAIGALHAGADGTWQNVATSGDYVMAGLFGDGIGTDVRFAGTPASYRMEGGGGGAYALYLSGGFSADLTAKADLLTLGIDFGGLAPSASTSVVNAGASGNVQYRTSVQDVFFEPTAGFSFTRTMFGDNAAVIGLTDGSTLRLQAGGRFGGYFSINGATVDPTVALLVYSNVVAEGTTLPTGPIVLPLTPTDQGLIRGEIDPELNVDFNNGYSAYVRSVFRFGQELFGVGAKIGLRRQF